MRSFGLSLAIKWPYKTPFRFFVLKTTQLETLEVKSKFASKMPVRCLLFVFVFFLLLSEFTYLLFKILNNEVVKLQLLFKTLFTTDILTYHRNIK